MMSCPGLEQAAARVHRLWPSCLRLIPDLRDDHVRAADEIKLAVPFFCQTDWYSCGAVAGWSVLRYLHSEASFAAFYRDVNPLPLAGTSEGKLVCALRRHGVGVSIRRHLSFEDLHTSIECGYPVIVGVGYGYEDGDHWIVVYGTAKQSRRIFVCNWLRPGRSRQALSWTEFRALWNPRGRGLICRGKDEP